MFFISNSLRTPARLRSSDVQRLLALFLLREECCVARLRSVPLCARRLLRDSVCPLRPTLAREAPYLSLQFQQRVLNQSKMVGEGKKERSVNMLSRIHNNNECDGKYKSNALSIRATTPSTSARRAAAAAPSRRVVASPTAISYVRTRSPTAISEPTLTRTRTRRNM